MKRLHTPVRVALTLAVTAIAWHGTPLSTPSPAHASGTCTPTASRAADAAYPTAGFGSASAVIAAFNSARQGEGCSTPLSINDAAYDAANPQMQMFMLFNAERTDRGLPALQLDTSLLSQVDVNHSKEMGRYNYFAHPSPINQPGPSTVFNRLTVNPGVNGHWSNLAENIAAGFSTAGQAVFAYMYHDSSSGWGHRHNILGYTGTSFGAYNWVGVGVNSDYPSSSYQIYYSSDFLQSASWNPYSPPASVDNQAPSLSPPTITSGVAGGMVTVQAANVADAGAGTGAAGITGVVFYANTLTMDSGTGTANEVQGVPGPSGTWTASLSLPAGGTVHAVAVDGSGNFTDCPATATSCGSVQSTPTSTPSPSATSVASPTPTSNPSSSPTPTSVPTQTSVPSPSPTSTPPGGQLIRNGGFETGQSPWAESTAPSRQLVSTMLHHSGTSGAYLCGVNSCNHQISQIVTLPSTFSTATLTYWYYVGSQETSSICNDSLRTRVRTLAGTLIITAASACNYTRTNGWVQKSVNLAPSLAAYKGSQVQVVFSATTNASLPTTFGVDDVALNVG